MADNLRKFTTQEVLNKVYSDSSGNSIGINAATSKETLNAALDTSNSRLNVSLAGGTIGGDVTINGDLTVNGDGAGAYDEIVNGQLVTFRDDSSTVGTNDNIVIENDGSGDASLKFSLTGATDWFAYVDNSDSDKFKIRRSTTDHFTINESGNVGIGISPLAKFHAKTASNVNFTLSANSDDLRINAVNDAVDSAIGLEFNGADYEFLGTGASTFGGDVQTGKKIDILGASGEDVELRLLTDAVAGASDYWKIQHKQSDDALNFAHFGTGAYVNHLSIASSGNATFGGDVGINTDSGGWGLNVKGTGANVFKVLASDGNTLSFLQGNGGHATQKWFADGNVTKVFINTDGSSYFTGGNLGIGTASPDYQLELEQAGGGFLSFKTTDTELQNNDVLGTIQFGADDATASGIDIGAKIVATATDNFQTASSNVDAPTKLEFFTQDNTSTDVMSAVGATLTLGGDDQNATFAGTIASVTAITDGIGLNIESNSLTTGNVGRFYSDSSNTSARNLVEITNDHTGASGTTALRVRQDAPHTAIDIDSANTGDWAVDIQGTAHTTAGLLYAYSNSSDTGTRNLVEIHNDHASATGATALKIIQDSSNSALTITGSNYSQLQMISSGAENGIKFVDSGGAVDGYIYATAGSIGFLDENTAQRFKVDANSRISLSNNDSGTSGADGTSANTLLGWKAGIDINSGGINNTSIGHASGFKLTDGDDNTYLGRYAGLGNLTGSNNTFIGSQSGLSDNGSSHSNNTGVGASSLLSITTGSNNTAVGYQSLNSAGTSQNNVAVGYLALEELTFNGNSYNTAVGVNSGQELTTGIKNVFLGAFSGSTTTDVDNSVMIGYNAGGAVMTDSADGTVAIGAFSLDALTSGLGSTAVGNKSLSALQQGDFNTAIGYEALLANIDGGDNTAVGYRALAVLNIDSSDTSASYNTAVGARALDGIQVGVRNTVIGADAMGSADDNEDDNTAIGYKAMFRNNNGFSNTCIGSEATLSADNGQGQIAIGKGVSCIANETVTIGFGSNVASLGLDGSDTSWAASSDERLKENIVDATAGLDVINDLRPVTYNWKKTKDIDKSMPQYKDSDEPVLGKEYGESLHGFIAQEVKVVIDKHDSLKEGFKMWKQTDNGTQTLADGNLIPILVKAVQELTARVKELESK